MIKLSGGMYMTSNLFTNISSFLLPYYLGTAYWQHTRNLKSMLFPDLYNCLFEAKPNERFRFYKWYSRVQRSLSKVECYEVNG